MPIIRSFRIAAVVTHRRDVGDVEPGSAGRRATRSLFAVMASQHGVASTVQARGAGVTRAVEQRLVDQGALIRPLPGVIAVGGVRPSFPAQAMAATLRPGVLGVSHGAAARLHRLAGFEEYQVIDVIGRRGSHLRVPPPITAHYSRGPLDQHLVRVGTIAVTSIPLTLALIVQGIGRAEAFAALDDVLGRGVPADSIRLVARQWREPGRSGPGLLLRLLDRMPTRSTRSAEGRGAQLSRVRR